MSDIEAWRRCWREGFAPQMSLAGLLALRDALERDDIDLVQGATVVPPTVPETADWRCEGACLIAYAGWKGDGLGTVGELNAYFGSACSEAGDRLDELAGCRHLLNWWDETPREEARPEMIAEVVREIERRAGA